MKKLKYKIGHIYVVVLDDEVVFEADTREYAKSWIEERKAKDHARLIEYNKLIEKKRAVGRQPPSPSC